MHNSTVSKNDSKDKVQEPERKKQESALTPSENGKKIEVEKLPPIQEIRAAVSRILRWSSFIGPMPPPEMQAGYKKLVPDAPERFFDWCERELKIQERQQEHRLRLENDVIHSDIRRANIGLAISTCITLLVIIVGFVLVLSGHDGAGVAFVGIDLVGLAAIYLGETSRRKDERIGRIKELARMESEKQSNDNQDGED